jgi:hypothetical protein
VKKLSHCIYLLCLLTIFLSIPVCVNAEDEKKLSNGQTVYVPAYSHIYFGNAEKPFLLTITLSIRNIDPKHAVKITQVDYFETNGNFLNKKIDKPITLKPLESIRYVIAEKEKTGGSGANFMVQWESEKLINPPIIESIMIGAKSGQGISFSSRGQAVFATD